MRKYSETELEQIVECARVYGIVIAAERFGVPYGTAYWMKRRADEAGGKAVRVKAPDYTPEEKDIIRRYADDINSGKLFYRQLAVLVSELGVAKRTMQGCWNVFQELGLRQDGGKRVTAERKHFQPFETVAERDEAFENEEEDDNPFIPWKAPQCLTDMLNGIVPKMEADILTRENDLVAKRVRKSIQDDNGGWFDMCYQEDQRYATAS